MQAHTLLSEMHLARSDSRNTPTTPILLLLSRVTLLLAPAGLAAVPPAVAEAVAEAVVEAVAEASSAWKT